MDVRELFTDKPLLRVKRATEDENDETKPLKKKRRTVPSEMNQMTDPSSVQILDQVSEENHQEILDMESDHESLDEANVKRIILNFEKRVLKNREMRIKFLDSPKKFMESEIQLHETLQEMGILATVPDYYPLLVKLRTIPSLLELLSHENKDITIATLELLQEMTDVDILNESKDGSQALTDSLLEEHVIMLLVQNLGRFDETENEESDGVFIILSIIENLTELTPEVCKNASKQGLLGWLLGRLQLKKPFNSNKLYVSELISILLQDSDVNRTALGELGGIETLLKQLSFYKRTNPSTADEHELMENMFNCLCSCLMVMKNRELFLRNEGLHLMNLMLRAKHTSRNGALKVLDYAMSGPHGRDSCDTFVDILGLRALFPLFMKTPKKNKTQEHEEHVCSIIASMLRNCRGSQMQRLISKFHENDFEKIDRLMEMHLKYLEKVQALDSELDDDEEEDSRYLERLEGGLFTLQLIDYMIVSICGSSPTTTKQRMKQILYLRSASFDTIKHIMREYAKNLGDAGDKEWKDNEERHILQLIEKF